MATNKCAIELNSLKHHADDIGIPEAYYRTKIYNFNKAAVQWAASETSKGTNNINLRDNMVQ